MAARTEEIKKIIELLKNTRRTMNDFSERTMRYDQTLKGKISDIKAKGLPREFYEKFENEHYKEVNRYLRGIADFQKNKTVRYIDKVIAQFESTLNTISKGR